MAEMALKMVFYITNYVKNGPKWLETVETIGKGVKIFKYLKFFSINSKKYKSFETFTHLSSDFQLQIPGDQAGGIHNHFFQVFTHALLMHFNIIFVDFHGEMRLFRPSLHEHYGPCRYRSFFRV